MIGTLSPDGRGRPKDVDKVSDNIIRDLILLNPRAVDEAAKLTGASPSYVSDAKRIKEKAPDLFNEIRAGKTTIPAAKRKLADPPIANTGPDSEPARPAPARFTVVDDPVQAALKLREYFRGERLAALIIQLGGTPDA
jgi:hypothetical protein